MYNCSCIFITVLSVVELNVGDDTWSALSDYTGPGNARVSNQHGTGDVPGEDVMLLP